MLHDEAINKKIMYKFLKYLLFKVISSKTLDLISFIHAICTIYIYLLSPHLFVDRNFSYRRDFTSYLAKC